MTVTAFDAGLDEVRQSPTAEGRVELVVRRPATDEREVLAEGLLDVDLGLVGDKWSAKKRRNRQAQLTLMNARAAALVAGTPDRVPLAGDQLFVDLDLSEENLPAGSRLAVGEAIVEISPMPHLGCKKFAARYGEEARAFVNSPLGCALRLRGVNAFVVAAGAVRPGDAIVKL